MKVLSNFGRSDAVHSKSNVRSNTKFEVCRLTSALRERVNVSFSFEQYNLTCFPQSARGCVPICETIRSKNSAHSDILISWCRGDQPRGVGIAHGKTECKAIVCKLLTVDNKHGGTPLR